MFVCCNTHTHTTDKQATHAHTPTRTHAHTHTRTHTQTHTFTHTHTHTCIHRTQTHTHTHTHRLDVSPLDCISLNGTPAGVRAAASAGMTAIGIKKIKNKKNGTPAPA